MNEERQSGLPEPQKDILALELPPSSWAAAGGLWDALLGGGRRAATLSAWGTCALFGVPLPQASCRAVHAATPLPASAMAWRKGKGPAVSLGCYLITHSKLSLQVVSTQARNSDSSVHK